MKRIFALLTLAAATTTTAELLDESQFLYRASVSFPGYTFADDTQENFPVLVRLVETEGGFSYADASVDGSDIRFTLPDGTILPSEVSLWDPDGESLAWVSIPELAVGTQILLYWGGTHAFPASQTDGSVWTAANYFAVWHMDEPNTSTTAKDSAGGDMEGTHVNTMPGQTEAKVGRSVRISTNGGQGSKENKGIPTAAYSNVGDKFTLSLWAKYPNQGQGADRIASHKNNYNDTDGWEISGMRWNADQLDFRGASDKSAQAALHLQSMDWTHLMFVFNGTKGTFYKNKTWTSEHDLTPATDNDVILTLGNAPSVNDVSFKGWMDEVRLRKGETTRNWIHTEYNSVNNASFASVGTAEAIQSDEDIPVLGAVSATADGRHSATLSWSLRTASASDSATVTVYYGTDSANLSQSLLLASGAGIATGAHSSTLTGLECATTWFAKVIATGDDGNAESDVVSFTTAGAPVFGSVESSVDGLAVTISGSLSDAGSVPLDVTAHFGANAATWTTVGSWSGVAAARDFEADATAPSLGDYAAGFRATGTCPDCGHVFDVASDAIVVPVFGECRWTGATGNLSWNTPGNWSSGTVPASKDTAVFGTEVSLSGATISLDSAQGVGSIIVENDEAFTIGSAEDIEASYTIAAEHLVRSGTEAGELAFAVPFVFAEPDNGTNTLAAAADIRFGAGIGATESRPLLKTGVGTVTLAGPISGSHPKIWVKEGRVSATAANSIRGDTWVGGGTEEASLVFTRGDAVAMSNAGSLTVLTNGTATLRDLPWGHFYERMNAYDGGSISCNGGSYALKVTLRGATMSCGGSFQAAGYWGQGVESLAAGQTSYFRSGMTLNPSDPGNPAYITVADGEAPVDLVMTGALGWIGGSSKPIRKNGDGVLKTTAANGPSSSASFQLYGGTLLCDNASGSPIGNTALAVGGGATLGGIGFIGGTERGDVTVAGASANPAVIAPGSIDETTGAHLFGTLTVGTEAQTNAVVFGNYSKLSVGISGDGTCDSLRVVGSLDLSGSLDTLAVTIPGDGKVRGGTYVLASATEGITGQFDTVVLPVGRLAQTATQITLTTADPTVMILR